MRRFALAPLMVLVAAAVASADAAGDAYRKAEDAMKANRFAEAIAGYREGLALRKDIGAWVSLGNALFRAARPREAAEAYRGALDMDAKCEPALLNLARAYDAEGDRALAIRSLERALDLFPERPQLREDLALLYAQTGRGAEAKALLESTIALAPDRAATWRALGETLARLNERERAVECLEAAARLGLEDRALDRLLGDLYLGLHMPVEAFAAYRRVEKAPGATTEDAIRCARAADEAGDDEAAIASFHSVATRPGIDKATAIRAYGGLFKVLMRTDRRTEASEVLGAVVALDSSNPLVERMKRELEPVSQK
jgi:tetratricopeptide (TPR) repeat protein